jgi:hypothetical protein
VLSDGSITLSQRGMAAKTIHNDLNGDGYKDIVVANSGNYEFVDTPSHRYVTRMTTTRYRTRRFTGAGRRAMMSNAIPGYRATGRAASPPST